MQTVLEQGSIDKPLTFDVGLIQLSFIPVCSLNTCNISVKLCRGFALQCFSLLLLLITIQEHTDYNESEILYGKHELTQLLKVHNRLPIRPEGYMCLRCNASSAWATNIPCAREMYAIIGGKVIPKSTMN